MKPFGRIEHSGRFADTAAARSARYYFTVPGDFLVTTRDLTTAADFLGLVARVPEDKAYLVNQGANVLRVDEAVVDARYFVYWTCSDTYRRHIQERHTGSTQIHIRADDLLDAPVFLPPIEDQRRIVEVLSALDDKVDLNRRMNETLDAIARRVFGKAALVAASTVPVDDVATINATQLRSGDGISAIEYVEISEVSQGYVGKVVKYERGTEPSRARRRVAHGDTVLSTVRPDRRAYFLALNPAPSLVVSTGFAVVSPKTVPWSYLHVALTDPSIFEELGRLADGGAYPAVRPEIIAALELPKLSDEDLRTFHEVVAPLLERAAANRNESQTLAELRDTLLPKLLSGELRVREAEEVVTEATAGATA